VLRKDGRTITERSPSVFRVVSGLRELKGETRAWVCNETGRYEVARLHRAKTALNQDVNAFCRGDIVRIHDIIRSEKQEKMGGIARITATSRVEKL